MYLVMKILIERKIYLTLAEVSERLDTFYAFKKLTQEEYTELTLIAKTQYDPAGPVVIPHE